MLFDNFDYLMFDMGFIGLVNHQLSREVYCYSCRLLFYFIEFNFIINKYIYIKLRL
jgi:hypothetical protein